MSKRRSSFRRRWRRFARMHPTLAGNLRWTAALAAVLIAGLVLILLGWRQRLKQPSPVEEDAVRAAAMQTAASEETPLLPEETQESEPTEAPSKEPTAYTAAEDMQRILAETSRPTVVPDPTVPMEPLPTVAPMATVPPQIDGVPAEYYTQTVQNVADYSDPAQNGLIRPWLVVNDSKTDSYTRADEIAMPASVNYTELEGIVTFRGSNYRDGASYGKLAQKPTSMSIVWEKRIGALDDWSGVGWTGQASAVRWPEELRLQMNLNADKKNKDGLVEVLYGTLDGRIYFLDLDDGSETRSAINIGAPIKGSLSIDPRGIPLLYCGQGIYDVGGRRVDCGTRIWSLIDQSLLYFIDGRDDYAVRKWRTFDSSPLVDATSDTLIQCGENGVLYTLKLNTKFENGKVSISPETVRYVYEQSIDGQVGTENSLAIYDHYAYFANNVGIIQCVDLNTMELKWCFNAQNDIDASLVIEVEADGTVALYGANEQDKRGSRGRSQMFKLNALTGEMLWYRDSDKIYQNDKNGGGSFATPCVGKESLGNLVYFHICRTEDTGAVLYALNKADGEIVWRREMGRYGWSTPTCVYTEAGDGYLLVGSSNGMLRLLDGLTGEQIAAVDLDSNIEGSPMVFEGRIVVGTRGQRIFGVQIS